MFDKEKVYSELKELAKFSYSPYSKFRVSCILYLKNGDKIEGVNVENAAYSPTLCAERNAYGQLVAKGYGKNDIELVALYTDSKGVGTMCGVCRQFMIELTNKDQNIWVFNKKSFCLEAPLKDFLPYYFDKEML